MGVSDFLMMSLAKLTVAVGKQVKDAVADTEVSHRITPHITLLGYIIGATDLSIDTIWYLRMIMPIPKAMATMLVFIQLWVYIYTYTVEPLIKDTPNKGFV